jgi:hypothetical protein
MVTREGLKFHLERLDLGSGVLGDGIGLGDVVTQRLQVDRPLVQGLCSLPLPLQILGNSLFQILEDGKAALDLGGIQGKITAGLLAELFAMRGRILSL